MWLTSVIVVIIWEVSLSITQASIPGLKSEIFRQTWPPVNVDKKDVHIRCAQACLRLGFEECNYIIVGEDTTNCITTVVRPSGVEAETPNSGEFEIIFQEGAFIKIMKEANYTQASEECARLKGSLASYDQLVCAYEYGHHLTCDQCWLISGEITFTNSQTGCQLVGTSVRFNTYPDHSALYSCFYCYIYYNLPLDGKDYHSTSRHLHLVYDNSDGYIYAEAESRCEGELGGHLALPMEVYNASVEGVYFENSRHWYSHGMSGKCGAEDGESSCLYALSGTHFAIPEHHDDEVHRGAFCMLGDLDTDRYPFPPHGVIWIRGLSARDLNYAEAQNRCIELGGGLATQQQVSEAHGAGYMCKDDGWISERYMVMESNNCVFSGSPTDENTDSGGYCHVPNN